MNRYLVKIDDCVLPDTYTFDELLVNGILDKMDECIQVKRVEDERWVMARHYPFEKYEAPIEESPTATLLEPYVINENGEVIFNCENINSTTTMGIPEKPSNNMTWAILVTLLCCPILGIISIVHASKVNELYEKGEYSEAERHAKEAKQYAIAGAVIGFILGILNGIITAAMQ